MTPEEIIASMRTCPVCKAGASHGSMHRSDCPVAEYEDSVRREAAADERERLAKLIETREDELPVVDEWEEGNVSSHLVARWLRSGGKEPGQ